MTYLVLKCPHCGKAFIRQIRGYNPNLRAKCPYCNKTFAIWPKRSISRIIGQFDNPFEAREYAVKVNNGMGRAKEEDF